MSARADNPSIAPPAASPPSPTPPDAVEAHARRVMSDLCSSLAALLESCRAGHRATDVGARLGLDKSLAWHLVELAQAKNPLLAAEHLPGGPGFDLVLAAATAKGAAPEALARVRSALSALRQMQAQHAGDPATFISMLVSLAGDPGATRTLKLAQRNAFKANTTLFGIRAACIFQADVTSPNRQKPGFLDFAFIRSWLGLCRLRPGAAFVTASVWDYSSEVSPTPADPLDPESIAAFGLPLVRRFCTEPVPAFKPAKDERGRRILYVSDGPIGNTGAVDITLGECFRGQVSARATHPGESGTVFVRLHVPSEVLVHDWLIHRDLTQGLWQGRAPAAELVSEMWLGEKFPAGHDVKPRLPLHSRVQLLGPADVAPAAKGVRDHRAMHEEAVARMGWTLSDFDVYRLVIDYPPVPAAECMSLPLPGV